MIQFDNVYKFYPVQGHKKMILDHVSTVFESGRSYALLGVNGAGKSTTIRLIAGIEGPNSGRIRRTVRVSWPLGFGTMFHHDMSGSENVRFVARVYGEDARRASRFVEDFAEIGDYYNAPVKTYSSGMFARLAFGLSMAIDFECYLIDEILGVGDTRFQARCADAFAERSRSSDLIVVSHSMESVKKLCQRGAVLVDGHLMMFDTVDKAIAVYNRLNR